MLHPGQFFYHAFRGVCIFSHVFQVQGPPRKLLPGLFCWEGLWGGGGHSELTWQKFEATADAYTVGGGPSEPEEQGASICYILGIRIQW